MKRLAKLSAAAVLLATGGATAALADPLQGSWSGSGYVKVRSPSAVVTFNRPENSWASENPLILVFSRWDPS